MTTATATHVEELCDTLWNTKFTGTMFPLPTFLNHAESDTLSDNY